MKNNLDNIKVYNKKYNNSVINIIYLELFKIKL